MSQIIFGGTVSMINAATPSTGWVVGYDLDGILKQKDSFGVIQEIGGGPTAGLPTIPNLENVLLIGNDSGTGSIIMGTSTYIRSSNGGGKLELDYLGNTNSILLSTDNSSTNEHGLILQNGYAALFANGYQQAIELDNGSGDLSIYNINGGSVLLGVSTGTGVPYSEIDEIKISYNSTATQSTGDTDKQSIFIGTRNSFISNGVVNSVVIGGAGITASTSNSVYVPDLYIQSQKGIKSLESDQVLFLNDTKGDTYLDRTNGTFEKSWVWMTSNYGSKKEWIELGVNSDPGYGSSSKVLIYNSKGPSYSWSSYTSIDLDKSTLTLKATDLDNSSDEFEFIMSPENNQFYIQGPTATFKGIEYVDDYSGSYSVRSLVDKNYVDTQLSSLGNPDIYTVLGAGNDTKTRNIILGTATHIKSGNPLSGGQINLDFASNSILLSTDNAGLSTAYMLLSGTDISFQSTNLYLQANDGQVEIGNNQGLKYTTQQTNFQNRSLIDKEYVDTATMSIWSYLSITPQTSTASLPGYVVYTTGTNSLSSTSSMFFTSEVIKGTEVKSFGVGNQPSKVFFEKVGKKVYTSNSSSNDLTILSNPTGQILGTVSVGTQPNGISYDEVNNRIYITNEGSNNVTILNPDTLAIVGTVSVGTFPMGIEYVSGKMYVANLVSNNISVIDTTTNLVTATISTSSPREFTYDYVNDRLWFIGVGPDYVGVLNPNTNTIITSIQVGSNPYDLDFDVNHERIWVTNYGANSVSVIDANTYLNIATVSVGTNPHPVAVNSLNDVVYVGNYSTGEINEINSNFVITSTFSTGVNTSGLVYNENNNYLYTTGQNDDTLRLLQTQDIPKDWIGINKTNPSSQFDVEGRITTTEFRLRKGYYKDYVLTSDASGIATWQPKILEIIGGTGLTGSGTSGVITISVDTTTLASNLDGSGLTANSGILSVNTDNGLSIVSDNVVLGGTLSQNTFINGDGFDLSIENVNNLTLTASVASLKTDNGGIEINSSDNFVSPTTESYINLGASTVYLRAYDYTGEGSVSISESAVAIASIGGSTQSSIQVSHYNYLSSTDGSVNSMIVRDDTGDKGLVYFDDYTGNFTTHSLVTKGYVDSVASAIGATNGLYEASNGIIALGGTLSQNTNINADNKDFTIGNVNNLTFNTSNLGAINFIDNNITSSLIVQNGSSALYYEVDLGSTYSYIGAELNQILLENNGTLGTSNFKMVFNPETIGDGSNDNTIIITDASSKGIVYANDYSSNFTTYSLVTKGYVDSTSTSKYSTTVSFTSGVSQTITHSLGTDEVIVQCYDSSGIQVIPGTIQINGLNAVDITFSISLSNIKTIIIG